MGQSSLKDWKFSFFCDESVDIQMMHIFIPKMYPTNAMGGPPVHSWHNKTSLLLKAKKVLGLGIENILA